MGEQIFFDKCPCLCAGVAFGQRNSKRSKRKAGKLHKVSEKRWQKIKGLFVK